MRAIRESYSERAHSESAGKSSSKAIVVRFTAEAFLVQEFGGVSRCFAELVRALDDAGEIKVGVSALVHGNAHLRGLPSRLVHGRYLPIKGDLRKVAIHLPRLAFELQARLDLPELVHDTGHQFCARKARGFPVLMTVHDMIQEADPKFAQAMARSIAQKRAAIARATMIVVPSQGTRDELIESSAWILRASPSFIMVRACRDRTQRIHWAECRISCMLARESATRTLRRRRVHLPRCSAVVSTDGS